MPIKSGFYRTNNRRFSDWEAHGKHEQLKSKAKCMQRKEA
jgi:hypothetical protein